MLSFSFSKFPGQGEYCCPNREIFMVPISFCEVLQSCKKKNLMNKEAKRKINVRSNEVANHAHLTCVISSTDVERAVSGL